MSNLTITFYQSKFFKNGEARPLCTPEEYGIYGGEPLFSTVTELGFSTKQTSLKLLLEPQQAKLAQKANYIGVMDSSLGETFLYWLDELDLATPIADGEPYLARLSISFDPVQTYAIPDLIDQKGKVAGRLVQTNDELFAGTPSALLGKRVQSPIEPIFKNNVFGDDMGVSLQTSWGGFGVEGDSPNFKGGSVLVIALSLESGVVKTVLYFGYFLLNDRTPVRGIDPFKNNLLYNVGNISKYSETISGGENASVVGAWLLPFELFKFPNELWEVSGNDVIARSSGEDQKYKATYVYDGLSWLPVYSVATNTTTVTNALPWVHYLSVSPIGGGFVQQVAQMAYVMTPKRMIPIEGTYFERYTENSWKVPVYLLWANKGENAEGVRVLIGLNGATIDITDDFSFPYATNAKSVEMSQQGTLMALRSITTAISGIGGTFGSLEKGNVAGAAGSALGAATQIYSQFAALRNLAQMQSRGGATTQMNSLGLLGASTLGVLNGEEIEKECARAGAFFTERPFVELTQAGKFDFCHTLTGNFLQGDGRFYRLENVFVAGLRGGQACADELSRMLQSGLRLIRKTA